MNSKSVLLFSCLTLMTPQALAQSAPRSDGFYLALVGGAQFFDGIEAADGTGIDFDTGYVIGGQVGYRVGQLRAETELAYEAAELEDVDGDVFDTEVIRGAASLFFDFTEIGTATPYVGGGVGIANISIEGTNGSSFEDDKTGITFHGETGLAFNLASNFAIVPQYRFEWFDTNEVANVQDDLYAHAVRVAGRFSF